jgi:hypothetical protein
MLETARGFERVTELVLIVRYADWRFASTRISQGRAERRGRSRCGTNEGEVEVLPAGGDAQRSTLTRVKLGDPAGSNRYPKSSEASIGLGRRWTGTEGWLCVLE